MFITFWFDFEGTALRSSKKMSQNYLRLYVHPSIDAGIAAEKYQQ